jgi:hypothetical protein
MVFSFVDRSYFALERLAIVLAIVAVCIMAPPARGAYLVSTDVVTIVPPDSKAPIAFQKDLNILSKEPIQIWTEEDGGKFLYTLSTIGNPWPFLDADRLDIIWAVSPIPIDVTFAFDGEREGIVIHKLEPNSVGSCKRLFAQWKQRKISKEAEQEILGMCEELDRRFQEMGAAESKEVLAKLLKGFYENYDKFHENTSAILHEQTDVTTKHALLLLTEGIRRERILWRRLSENSTNNDGVIVLRDDQWRAFKNLFPVPNGVQPWGVAQPAVDGGARYKLDEDLAIPELSGFRTPQHFRYYFRHIEATVAVMDEQKNVLGTATHIGGAYFLTCAHGMINRVDLGGSDQLQEIAIAKKIASPHEMGIDNNTTYDVDLVLVGKTDFCILKIKNPKHVDWWGKNGAAVPLSISAKKPVLETYRFILTGHPKNNGGYKQVAVNGFVKFPEELKLATRRNLIELAGIKKQTTRCNCT